MNLIDIAVLSERRRDMLLLIEEKPRSFEEIKDLLDLSSASIRIHLKKLVNSRLLVEEKGKYEISEMAAPMIKNLKELLSSLTFFEKNIDYWTSHSLVPIPTFLRKRLGELGNLEFIERDNAHMFEIPGIILENIRKSKEVFIFFSCLHPGISNIYTELSERELEISLCVTGPIIERLFRDSPIETRKLLEVENSKLFYCPRIVNLPVLVVTDRFMAIELFRNGGSLSNQVIVNSDKEALKWGKELYNYFEGCSESLTLKLEHRNSLSYKQVNSA